MGAPWSFGHFMILINWAVLKANAEWTFFKCGQEIPPAAGLTPL
jgi:hypothetical protein